MINRAAVAAAVLLMTAGVLCRAATPNTPAAAPGNAEELGPWTPVCRYVRMIGGSPPEQVADPGKQFCLDPAKTSGWHVTTLIATIPNPELTHLSLTFDRYIESITWALDDGDIDRESYSFDSYWFPWRSDQKAETDPDKGKAADKDRDRRSDMPGILLFRRSQQSLDPARPHPEKDLLMVFLVGETPTDGINRAAFNQAWDYATNLANTPLPICGNARNDPKSCVAILGPSFTGSLPSLKLLLDNRSAKSPGHQTFVISGAVTGEDPSTATLPENTHFCTTIETDQNRWAVFTQVLNHLSKASFWDATGEVPKHFALLGEDQTEYGNLQKVVIDGRSLLTLRFPRGIARIRNSFEQLPGLATPPRNTAYPDMPLVLRDTGQDTIPSFSQQQSPVSQWAVLVELAATLRREGIRYVGIVATDPLDALFLSRAIRALAPNIRIVLFSADLLFARASDPWDLSGTLAVTSYPLISRNQYYSRAVRPRRAQFANDAAEGVYNACRRMLLLAPETNATSPCSAVSQAQTGKDYLLDYAPPFAQPNHKHKPAVWLTILGRNEWWPVAASPVDIESRLLEGPAPASHSTEQFSVETSPRPWFLFFWIIWSACALHVVIFFGMNIGRRSFWPWWENKLLRRLAMGYQRDLATRRRATLAAASLTVAFACCSLIVAIWASGLQGWGYLSGDDGSGYLQLASAIVIGGSAIIEALWAVWGIEKPAHRRSWLVAVAAAAAAEIAGTVYALFSASIAHVREFAGYRAIHIESGASPLLPVILLLLPIYLFCWWRLSRLRTDEERHASAPAGEDARAFPGLSMPEGVQKLGPGQLVLVAAGLLVWLIFFNPLKSLASIEGAFYDVVVSALSTVVLVMYVLILIRFFVAWRKLRKMLQRLERHPLRYAFTRLPRNFSWTSVWAGDPRPPALMLTRSLDALRMTPGAEVQALANSIDVELSRNPNHTAPPYHLVPHRVASLNRSLNKAFGLLSMQLQPAWNEGLSDSFESREKKEEVPADWKDRRPRIAAEEFLAGRFVTFIGYTLRIMRGFLGFISSAFILLVVALCVYPFEGQRYIEFAIVCLFVMAGVTVGTVFAQMDRDPLLSRLNETKPNQLGLSFVYRMISYGALPLITLLASLVPNIGNFLQSWLQPALQSLK